MGITKKFVCIFIVFMLIPFIISNVLYINKTIRKTINNEVEYSRLLLTNMINEVDYNLAKYNQYGDQLYDSDYIFKALKKENYLSENDILNARRNLQGFTGKPHINSTYLFLNNGQVIYRDNYYSRDRYQKIHAQYLDYIKDSEEKYSSFSNTFLTSNHKEGSQGKYLLPFYKYIRNIHDNLKDVGVLLFNIDIEVIEEVLDELVVEGLVIIADDNGDIIYHKDKQWIGSSLTHYEFYKQRENEETFHTIDGEKFFMIKEISSLTRWEYIYLIPKMYIDQEINYVLIFIGVVFGLGVLFFFIGYFLIHNQIIKRLKIMVVAMDQVENSHNQVQLKIQSRDEIGTLFKSFNRMNQRIKNLMKEKEKVLLHDKEMEIKALKSQINPHFLYNTLDSINWLVRAREYKEAVSTIQMLSKILRYSLGKSGGEITIANELEWLQNYMFIQKVRFRDKFKVEYNIDPHVLQYKTMHLLLQPFVENAIIHGMRHINQDGLIRVSVQEDLGDIIIEVFDNGQGFSEEQLKQATSGKGIGIRNISDSLRLSYGFPYGVKIESEKHQYTCVTIKHPIIE